MAAIILLIAGPPLATGAQEKPVKPQERIGVYDSRAVAVVYVGSASQQTRMKELQAQLAKARASGNTSEVGRLEREGKAWQTKLHQQGFNTAAVDDLLVHIKDELPDIRKAAGVTELISKWNLAELKKHQSAQQVDVTMALVDAFHPNEAQRKRAIEIQKLKPVNVKE